MNRNYRLFKTWYRNGKYIVRISWLDNQMNGHQRVYRDVTLASLRRVLSIPQGYINPESCVSN